jgi:hypothetical protein
MFIIGYRGFKPTTLVISPTPTAGRIVKARCLTSNLYQRVLAGNQHEEAVKYNGEGVS